MSTPGPLPRRPILVPFLVALVLLAVIGASVGWVYGSRVADERAASDGVAGDPTTPVVTGSPEPAPATTTTPPSGPACPDAAEAAATDAGSPGGLVEIFYIRTEDAREIWICRDTAGSLFYQGYDGSDDRPLEQGVTALFLSTVEQVEDGYLATNETPDGRTTYHVTPDLLTQTTNGTESTFQVAVKRPE